MQKYLLFTTGTGYNNDDDMLSNSGACLIDDFDTVEECIKKAREDLLAEATDTASNAVDEPTDEDEVNDYIQMYLHDTKVFELTEIDFPRIGASRNIIESEYHSDMWCNSRVYTVVRIA